MTAAPQNVNSDAPSRTWDDVKVEVLEARLKAAGVTLPGSPDADEMGSVTRTLSERDPGLLTLLLGAVVEPMPGDAADRMERSASKAARIQKMKKAPGKMLSSTNHKGREKPDGKLIKWVVGGVLAAGAIGFILFSPSGGVPAGVVKSPPAGAGAGVAAAGASSTGVGQPGGTPVVTVPAAGQQPAAPVFTSGLGGTNPPLPSPVVPQNTVMAPPLGSSMPGPVSEPQASLPPVPAPISPASMPVPLRTMQPPARLTYGTPKLLSITSPVAAREDRVVSTVVTGQAPANSVRSGIVASSVPVPSRVVAASPVSVASPAQGLSRQTQVQAEASSVQPGIVSAASGRAASVTGGQREGLISVASGQTVPDGRGASGLVSVSQTPVGTGTSPGLGVPSTAGLVSIAHQGQPVSEPSTGAQPAPAMAVMGAVPAVSVPASPFTMGSQLKAVINTGALFATPVGDSGQGVIQGQDQQLVYATAEDGSVWRGTPRLLSSGRVGISFDRVMVKGTVLKVLADATDDSGLPGVSAQNRTDSPKAASQLFQALLSGARTFAQASLQGDTSITASGTIVNQSAKPNFWVTLGGALAGSLSLPSPRITQLDVTTLQKGTPVVLVVRGEE